MIRKFCHQCGELVGKGHTHKVSWAGSTRAKRLPRNWPAIRRRILKRDPVCQLRLVCNGAPSTEVDHIARGDDHSDSNLQGACGPCHASKSAREGQAARAL